MAAQQDNPFLTITLTGRPPVKIKKEDWPVLASASDKEYDNQYEFQANRTATWKLTVRQHSDGRAIVYGAYNYDSHFQSERGYEIRGGQLLNSGASIPEAARQVGEDLESRMPDIEYGWSTGYFPRLIEECIADLPAEEI